MATLVLESFFIILGVILSISSYALYEHFTFMPNVRPPKRLSVRALDTFQFFLARDSSSGLLHLSPCPATHPLYDQAIRMLYDMPELTYDQVRYLRDLQYTFEMAMSAYSLACYNEETIRLAAKFMEDMHLLASEMYAIARRLNLSMQVRFPRECDDPILTSNQMKSNPTKNVKKSTGTVETVDEVEPEMISPGPSAFNSASQIEELIDFTGDLIRQNK